MPRSRNNGEAVTRGQILGGPKKPFDIHTVVRRIRKTVGEFADAAMHELYDKGFKTLFQQLVACIISIRTRDEVSLPVSIDLLRAARTPEAMIKLGPKGIDKLIRTSSFHEAKSYQIHAIAQRTVEEFGGKLPCDFEVLTSFKGVGPKCANLALGIACRQPRISVDVHVFRVTRRWGIHTARTPELTVAALETTLPKKYWIEINRLLVPFGKHICTGTRPKCSVCPVLEYCRQVGVTEYR